MISDAKSFDSSKLAAYTNDRTLPDPGKPRFAEMAKFMPVLFVLCIIATQWSVYFFCHCRPLMQHHASFDEAWKQLVVFNIITALLIVSYYRSVLQHPGTIPEDTPEEGKGTWEYAPVDGRPSSASPAELLQEQKERKRLGDRRNCKWCNKYKPDRCHHCRVCRICILKMDHHCPWIYNCVGFKNFKYFFLLVSYAAVASHIIAWSMPSSVRRVIDDPTTPFMHMFWTFFGQTLAIFMATVLTAFLGFHIHLMLRAMTTIEFCEKSRRPNFDTESYSQGWLMNLKASLGDNPLLWLLPICPPQGTGICYGARDAEVQLQSDLDRASNSTNGRRVGSQAGRSAPKNSKKDKKEKTGGTGEAPDNGESVSESDTSMLTSLDEGSAPYRPAAANVRGR